MNNNNNEIDKLSETPIIDKTFDERPSIKPWETKPYEP